MDRQPRSNSFPGPIWRLAGALLTYLQEETDRQHPAAVQATEEHVHQMDHMDHMDHSGHESKNQPMIQ